jgi:hypothetical protein
MRLHGEASRVTEDNDQRAKIAWNWGCDLVKRVYHEI